MDLILVTHPSCYVFIGTFNGTGSSTEGHTTAMATINSTKSQGGTITLNGPTLHKMGCMVMHTPGSINIELMWAETKADQTGLSCLFLYDDLTKEPKELRIAAQKSLSLLFITFNSISYVPCKQPKRAWRQCHKGL
jgi:hypothetical protein